MAKSTASTGRKAGAAADVLGALAALVPTKAAPKSGKPTKWHMVLTNEAKTSAERWVKAKTVLEPVSKRMENAKDEFIEFALRDMCEKLFASKTKPSNPLVVLKKEDGKTDDHQFQVTMTDKFKYRFPDVPEGIDPHEHFVAVFKAVGLHVTDAEKLVANELDFNPITGFKTLTELLEGSYGAGREWMDSSEESKAAGQKFAALLMWNGDADAVPEPLTPEEKMLVIERSPGMQVKAGFYDRVATYCQNIDQLMGIFKVIQPIIFPVYAKFAMNDTPKARTDRTIEAAAEILGTMTSEESDD